MQHVIRGRAPASARGLHLVFFFVSGCGLSSADPYDTDFEIPRTASFAPTLSQLGIYAEPIGALLPADTAVMYELNSELFTDYAHKQRFMVLPQGEFAALDPDGTIAFPDGTMLVKTLFYPLDFRDPQGPVRVTETQVLRLEAGEWNPATYAWNRRQSEATLLLDGQQMAVSWTDEQGNERTTETVVPHEGECVTCHQVGGTSAFLGPTFGNLNRMVSRDGVELNQLDYLPAIGVFEDMALLPRPVMADYRDTSASLSDRARAYLDVNCAHCHNPGGWDGANRDFDFRLGVPEAQSRLFSDPGVVRDALMNGDMPYLGTTLLHDEGIQLVLDFLDTL